MCGGSPKPPAGQVVPPATPTSSPRAGGGGSGSKQTERLQPSGQRPCNKPEQNMVKIITFRLATPMERETEC